MIVRFHGTRGTMPVGRRDRLRYGGNTPCVEVVAGDRRVIVDSGTGLQCVAETLPRGEPLEIDLILTHYHWDHIQGFPFFWPIYAPGNVIRIWGLDSPDGTPRDALKHQMARPVFPIQFGDLPSKLYCNAVKPGARLEFDGIDVYTGPSLHPGGCLGLRFEHGGSSFTHLTDTECPITGGGFHGPNLDLARDADLVSYDATFTEDEYHGRVDGVSRVGWGHATDEHAVAFADACGARSFLLYHHAPEHDDDFLDEIARKAHAGLESVAMSVDGLEARLDSSSAGRVALRYPKGSKPRMKSRG